jgi:hypothetical protein
MTLTILVKKQILLFVLLIPFLTQQFNAYRVPSFILSSIFFIYIFLFIIAVLIKNDKGRMLFLLKSPITIIIFLFILSQVITMITASNTLELLRMAFMTFLFKVFIIVPAFIFNFKINDILKYKKIIFNLFFIIIIGNFLTQIDFFEKLVTGVYYKEVRLERFGWEPMHSLMPIANSLVPYLLFFFLTFMIINKNKLATFVTYILVILASNRVSILLFSFIYLRHRLNFKKVLLGIVALLIMSSFFSQNIKSAIEEASFSDQEKIDMVPRLHYTIKSLEVFSDYKFFGIGLRRFSTESFWKEDNYFWQKTYGIHTEFINEVGYMMDFSVTDTGLVFLAEIGIIGTILLVFLFSYLIYIGKIVGNEILKLYVVAGLVYLYNITDPFNTYVFGIAFWFIVGVFLNEYYLIQQKKGKN